MSKLRRTLSFQAAGPITQLEGHRLDQFSHGILGNISHKSPFPGQDPRANTLKHQWGPEIRPGKATHQKKQETCQSIQLLCYKQVGPVPVIIVPILTNLPASAMMWEIPVCYFLFGGTDFFWPYLVHVYMYMYLQYSNKGSTFLSVSLHDPLFPSYDSISCLAGMTKVTQNNTDMK